MNKRQIFRAIFKGYALKTYQDHYTPAMVLGDVQTQQQLILRECTLTYTKQMQKLGFLMPGTILQFSARLKENYQSATLVYPTQITCLKGQSNLPVPTTKEALVGMIMDLNFDLYAKNNVTIVSDFLIAFREWQEKQTQKLPVTLHEIQDFSENEIDIISDIQDPLFVTKEEALRLAHLKSQNDDLKGIIAI